jgi:hypothetical protein
MNRFIAFTLIGLTLPATLALAQDAALTAAYKAGVAGAKCNLGLDSDKSSQLGDAVQRAEQRSGLAQGDLDALWSKTEAEADADNAAFCADAAALVDKAIAAK